MTLGTILLIAYWVLFVIRKEFVPRQYRRAKAVAFDMRKQGEEKVKAKARRMYWPVTIAGWLLKAVDTICLLIAAAMVMWLVYFVGALISGTFVFFGYPV